jgi:chaperonin GroEL
MLELVGDEAIGRDVVRRALAEPLRWITINAGFEGDDTVDVVVDLNPRACLNALTGEYGDVFVEGIFDPFKVTGAALESAASIAALPITTETAVVEEINGSTRSHHGPRVR